VTAILVLLQ